MDTYEVGNYIHRWANYTNEDGERDDPFIASCKLTDPSGCTNLHTLQGGNVRRLTRGRFCLDMIASRPGEWSIQWLPDNGYTVKPDTIERFCIQESPTVQYKTFHSLDDGNGLTLVPLSSAYLDILRSWRNRDDIRRWFFTSDVISEADQAKWYYGTYVHDMSDYMWIAHLDGKPIGTGALTHIDLDKREGEWARLIIGENSVRGKGLAHRIAALVRDYALDVLKLERIYGALYTDNAITMHIDMTAGYMPYKVEGDVTHVELWRRDWRK